MDTGRKNPAPSTLGSRTPEKVREEAPLQGKTSSIHLEGSARKNVKNASNNDGFHREMCQELEARNKTK